MKLCIACGYRFKEDGWNCSSCGFKPEMETGRLIFAPEMATSNEGFDPRYFSDLAQLEEGHWWFRSKNKLIIWALRHYFSELRNLLEIGCGTGFILLGIQEAFPALFLSGGELFNEGISYAGKRLAGVTLFQMDARRIPFEEEFDVVSAFDLLEHIQEDEEVLFQMFKATKSGGGIIITVPQHHFLWSQFDEFSFHKRRYTRRELIQKVKKAGFGGIQCTSFVSFLLPLMMRVRIGRRDNHSEYEPMEELKIGRSLNKVLEKIMDIERFFIRTGISLPIGGSLLLVARKGWKEGE